MPKSDTSSWLLDILSTAPIGSAESITLIGSRRTPVYELPRYVVSQPNAIVSLEECIALLMHAKRINCQHGRTTVTLPNSRGGSGVLGKVHMVSLARA